MYSTGNASFIIESLEDRKLLSASYSVSLTSPFTRAVYQRDGQNVGNVTVEGTYTSTPSRVEARAVLMTGSGDVGHSTDWKRIESMPAGGHFSGSFVVPAGGWYRVDVRAVGVSGAGSIKSVSKVGVGDVIYLAGQSNMEGASASTVSKDDHVVMPVYSYNSTTEANPPTFAHLEDHAGPAPHGKLGPAGKLGDLIAANQHVPVMFLQTAAASTTVHAWKTAAAGGAPGPLKEYAALKQALQRYVPLLGGARAVLWHQGEEDADDGETTTTAQYASDLQYVISKSRADSGVPFLPWVVARVSSIRDVLPNVSPQDYAIERGQEQVIAHDANVFAGPLTDDLPRLAGNNPHYTVAGQITHGQRWFERLNASVYSTTPIVSIRTIKALAAEGGRFGRMTVLRTGPTDQALTVHFLVGGKAHNGVDYRDIGNTITFQPGQSYAHINILAYADNAPELSESITVTLQSGPGYALKTYDPMRKTPIGTSDDDILATTSASVRISSQR